MPGPIHTLHLIYELDEKLIALLRALRPEDWGKPTLARQWKVKDVAAHLLDGNIRGTAMLGHNFFGESPGEIKTYKDLVNFLNQLNADWVKAMKRVSPQVLIELLEVTGKQYYQALAALPPFEPALFSVAWAGQSESPNWFHIAREYTEKWHHQQQIREAVGMQAIMTKEFFQPLMNTFMQALPHAYRNTGAPNGTGIRITVTTECGGDWMLLRNDGDWQLVRKVPGPTTGIVMDPDTAWKLFTKALPPEEARQRIQLEGNRELGEPILSMLTVMA
jgi:uncharacterized protein (TIGR03083 family)